MLSDECCEFKQSVKVYQDNPQALARALVELEKGIDSYDRQPYGRT